MPPLSPRVLIVGAGQSGLFLGHRLLDLGFRVELITNQTSLEIRESPASVTQFAAPSTRALEEQAGLDLWREQAPRFERVHLSMIPPQGDAFRFSGRLGASAIGERIGGHAVSVDRRVKMADWLEYLEDKGAKVHIQTATLADLKYYVRMYDLVVVAVGAGQLGDLFQIDQSRFSGAHERVMVQAILDGVAWEGERQLDVYTSPHGEVFLTPFLTSQGEATSVTMLSTPGGGLDAEDMAGRHPGPLLAGMQTLLREHLPEVYERIAHLGIDDLVGGPKDITYSKFTPMVRKPVAFLDGVPMLGMADVVVTSDPIAGQGWANSTFCAQIYADAIAEHAHSGQPFDAEFMESAFERFYQERGRHSAVLAEMVHNFWRGTLPPHFGALVEAVLRYPEVADRWISGFNDPADYERWMFDPQAAQDYIAEVAARAGS